MNSGFPRDKRESESTGGKVELNRSLKSMCCYLKKKRTLIQNRGTLKSVPVSGFAKQGTIC